MIPILGIPILNRWDLLLRCVRSIDYPVNALMVIQNGSDDPDAMRELLAILQTVPVNHFHHVRTPNLGCGSSWNHVMLSVPASWWMFAGNDIRFLPGSLEKMARAADLFQHSHAAIFGNHGHSWFIQTKLGTRKVGLYDPNIFPAYLEDCDWMYRRQLTGIPYMDVDGAIAEHGQGHITGSATIYSDPRMRMENDRTHGNNHQYYRRKWGGPNGAEVFKTPFDSGAPINSITFDPELRDENVWRL